MDFSESPTNQAENDQNDKYNKNKLPPRKLRFHELYDPDIKFFFNEFEFLLPQLIPSTKDYFFVVEQEPL